jgi:acyl dehydratase
MERNFGDAWVYGGQISARYIHPVYAGDHITANGLVTEVAPGNDGKPRVKLQIWCENQDGRKTCAGTASAGQPSSMRNWMEARAKSRAPGVPS